MKSGTVTLTNKVGLHARPAAELIKTANKFQSKITISGRGKEANAKSIIMILSLGLRCGDTMSVVAEGPDEQEAVAAIIKLAEEKFHEE
ncbi:MAG: Phosphocarrier protein HPr [Clostridium sp.]|jgi:phosphocarrier protein HPr